MCHILKADLMFFICGIIMWNNLLQLFITIIVEWNLLQNLRELCIVNSRKSFLKVLFCIEEASVRLLLSSDYFITLLFSQEAQKMSHFFIKI